MSQFKSYSKFKNLGQILILMSLVLASTSCSEFLRGKPAEQDYIEIKSGSLDCLEDISQDMRKFLDSEASPETVDKTVNCISNTLTEFQTKVEGRSQADSFSSEEVYDIFSKFASEAKLSREAANNMILLKSALLGGDATRITKAEIGLLKTYLETVKAEAKKLIPYIKVYYLKETQKAFSKAFLIQAFAQLNSSVKVLLNASQLANSNYSFNDFKTFLINVLNLAGDEKNIMEILTKVNYVLNGYQTELSAAERLQYIDSITEFLHLYSLYANNYVGFDFEDLYALDDTINYVLSGIQLLENSLQYKKSGLVSTNSIERLLIEITAGDLLPHKVRASSAINIYKTIMVRLFESGVNGQVLNYTGIKAINLIHIKREIAVYQIYSRLLKRVITQEAINAGLVEHQLREVQRVMGALNIADETDILNRFDANNQYQIISVVNELRAEFLESRPVIYKNQKMGVAFNQETWTQNLTDLANGLFYKMIARLFMMGYGPDYTVMNINSQQISEAAMFKWYSEFKDIAIDVKSFDPRTANGGAASLKAGNLFTRAGNGDRLLNFKEALEAFGALLTGGGTISGQIEVDLKNANCNMPQLDVFDKHWNIESCMYNVIRSKYKTYYSNLTYLTAFLDGLNEAGFTQFFTEVVNIARKSMNTAGLQVETSDVRGMNSLLFFIESLYAAHDANQNWHLSESEIRSAYPKFKDVATEHAYAVSRSEIEDFTSWKGEVAGYGCFSEEDLIRESFIFLVYNGRTPSTSDFHTLPCFTGKPLMSFSGEVNRLQILKTFKALKDVIAP